jgi:transcriptional regulatory protein LevR
MKYGVDVDSGVMMYVDVPSLRKIGSGIQKLIGELHRHTAR